MTIPKLSPYVLPNAEELPQSRAPWQPDPARAVLLIHDMQRYFMGFFEPAVSPICEVVASIQTLKAACVSATVPIVYSAQPVDQAPEDRGLLTDMWGPGLPAHPDQADIVAELSPGAGDAVLRKTRYSAFHGTELLALMRAEGRDQLWICGVYGHIGCMLTAFDAFMNDVQPFLIADAIADFTRCHHSMALELVASRCGVVLHAQTLLARMATHRSSDVRARVLREVGELVGHAPGQLDLREDLLGLGLDSVRRMELTDRLQADGIEVSPLDVMECDSLEALCALVAGATIADVTDEPAVLRSCAAKTGAP